MIRPGALILLLGALVLSHVPVESKDAHCIIESDTGMEGQPIEGTITLSQEDENSDVTITVSLTGFDFTDGLDTHGFHVHAGNSVGSACSDMLGHFSSDDQTVHGGPEDAIRHIGDLGNVDEVESADDPDVGEVETTITDSVVSLYGDYSVIDRGIVVHETFDDLGLGGHDDSLTTGHAGGRLGCCVIQEGLPPVDSGKDAHCIIESDTGMEGQPIEGTIILTQENENADVTIAVSLTGFNFTDGLNSHGFHVHAGSSVGSACGDMLGHFSSDDQPTHGGPQDETRHIGDLGNVDEEESADDPDVGEVETTIMDSVVSLYGDYSVIGRGIVVHETFDDLGLGGHDDSLTTGHAGGRLGCCVIQEGLPATDLTSASCTITPGLTLVVITGLAFLLLTMH